MRGIERPEGGKGTQTHTRTHTRTHARTHTHTYTHIIHVHAFSVPRALDAIHIPCRGLFDLLHASLQLPHSRRLDILRLLCIHDLVLDL